MAGLMPLATLVRAAADRFQYNKPSVSSAFKLAVQIKRLTLVDQELLT